MSELAIALLATGVAVFVLGMGAVGSVIILPPIPHDDPGPARAHAERLRAAGERGMVAGVALVVAGAILWLLAERPLST